MTTLDEAPPPHPVVDKKQSRRIYWVLIVLSVLFHVFIFVVFVPEFFGMKPSDWQVSNEQGPRALPTQVLTEAQYRRMMDQSRPVVESAKAPRSKPDVVQREARFRGERTQRVERETVAPDFGSVTGGRTGKSGTATPAGKNDKSLLSKLGFSKGLSRFVKPAPLQIQEGEGGDDKLVRHGNLDSLPKDIAVGSETLLNTDEYVYASFYNRMKAEVAPRWEPLIQELVADPKRQVAAGFYQTQTVFTLDWEGNVMNVDIAEPSGYVPFDEAARASIRAALRFKNPPAALLEKDGFYRIKLGFNVNLANRGVQMNYVPDPRFQ